MFNTGKTSTESGEKKFWPETGKKSFPREKERARGNNKYTIVSRNYTF